MNATIKLLLPFLAVLTAFPAKADVVVVQKVMQKGLFSPPKCNGDAGCLCESDITYPVITGMQDSKKQELLNNDIEKSAEQLKCQGTPVKAKNNGDNFSVRHSYEVTFNSPGILAIKFADWAYEGGAHGNTAVEGMIIDLAKGNVLSVNDVFGAKNIAPVNAILYDTLTPKSEGVFRDEIEGRKGTFIKDNKCQGCTLMLTKDGVQVMFQAYEVAPFADGTPTITIPKKYVVYPELLKALGESK